MTMLRLRLCRGETSLENICVGQYSQGKTELKGANSAEGGGLGGRRKGGEGGKKGELAHRCHWQLEGRLQQIWLTRFMSAEPIVVAVAF